MLTRRVYSYNANMKCLQFTANTNGFDAILTPDFMDKEDILGEFFYFKVYVN